ncbi:MAG: hypothetical protein QM784_06815 [Polyangiaceae bacterium]
MRALISPNIPTVCGLGTLSASSVSGKADVFDAPRADASALCVLLEVDSAARAVNSVVVSTVGDSAAPEGTDVEAAAGSEGELEAAPSTFSFSVLGDEAGSSSARGSVLDEFSTFAIDSASLEASGPCDMMRGSIPAKLE